MAGLTAAVLLLLLTAVLYLPGTGTIPLTDRDEPRFAHATVEMMERDTWLIPYFNGVYRFDKPPLTYWWMRLHYSLLGVNETAARMHSVVAVWLVSLVVFAMGKRMSGTTAAWWGAIGWLTSFQALVHGRLCVADMPMVFCVALAVWSLGELLVMEEVPSRRFGPWWWTLWLSLGAGFLAKGPIALLVPGLALVLWRYAFWRRPVPWSRLRAGWGALLALGMVAAWGIPALLETQGLFWKVGMGEHVVKRGTQALNGRMILPGYYLLTAFLSLLPWIAFLPLVISTVRRQWNSRMALLVAWFTAPQIIFLLYATQLPHYTMPGFPAFFVLLGLALQDSRKGLPVSGRWLLGAFGGLALMVLVLVWGTDLAPEPGLRTVLACTASILASLVMLGAAAGWRSRPAMVLACAVLAVSLVPLGRSLRGLHPAVQMAPEFRALPQDAALVAWQFTEPSLVFYADRPWTMLSKLDKVQDRIVRRRVDGVVLLVREWTLADAWRAFTSRTAQATQKDFTPEVEALTSVAKAQGFVVRDVRGLNLARSSWVEVRLLVKR